MRIKAKAILPLAIASAMTAYAGLASAAPLYADRDPYVHRTFDVVTPFSPNESGPAMTPEEEYESHSDHPAYGATSGAPAVGVLESSPQGGHPAWSVQPWTQRDNLAEGQTVIVVPDGYRVVPVPGTVDSFEIVPNR
jgi:hypothetical protein